MKFLCSLGLHCWEAIQSSEFIAEQYTLFGKDYENLHIGTLITQKCKQCGKGRQRVLYFSQSEIVLQMLREVAKDLEQSGKQLREATEGLKDNNKKLGEVARRLELKNSNETLRKKVEGMNEAVRRLKEDGDDPNPLEGW